MLRLLSPFKKSTLQLRPPEGTPPTPRLATLILHLNLFLHLPVYQTRDTLNSITFPTTNWIFHLPCPSSMSHHSLMNIYSSLVQPRTTSGSGSSRREAFEWGYLVETAEIDGRLKTFPLVSCSAFEGVASLIQDMEGAAFGLGVFNKAYSRWCSWNDGKAMSISLGPKSQVQQN
ncbi:hypothetical protein JOM56_011373 [Amanita muscaria]